MFNLVKTYQIHSHSRKCRKYKNSPCKYRFGRFFTEKTIIAKPIKNVSEYERFTLLQHRKSILDKVSDFVNEFLCPGKIDSCNNGQVEIDTVLAQIGIPKADYYWHSF